MIYGENFIFAEHIPNLVGVWRKSEHRSAQGVDLFRERFRRGEADQDMSGLLPPYNSVSQLLKKQFYEYFYLYNHDAISMDRERWGFKHQIISLSGFLSFHNLASTARYIFMYRDIIEVLKSYRARFGLEGPAQAAHLSEKWKNHVSAMRSLDGENCLHIELTDLERDPEHWARKIEDHCSLPPINIDVLKKKINVSDIIDSLSVEEKALRYRAPAELSNSEIDAILTKCGDFRSQLGYH